MTTKPKLRFSIATLLWLMVCVAVFFGGRMSVNPDRGTQRLLESYLDDVDKQYTKNLFLEQRHRDLVKGNRVLSDLLKAPSVVQVEDGDNILVVDNHELVQVRINGIDCPATNQPFGEEARQFTIAFCLRKRVELIGKEKDSDGRRLANPFVNGESLREALLSAGLAWHDKRNNDVPVLAALEEEAKAAKRGLWADDDAVPPWEWRKL